MRRALGRLARGVAVGVLAFCAVLVGGSAYFSHAPFEIPERYRAPDVLDPARPAGLRLRYAGVAGYELTDGETTLLFDPVITRPTIFELATGPVEIEPALVQETFPRADYVLVNHAHHDHGGDAPTIARQTGAQVVGSPSMTTLARIEGVPETQLREIVGGETLELGAFEVRVAKGDHAPLLGMPFLMRGKIDADEDPPLWFFEYQQDAAFAFHVSHPQGSLLFHPQSGYIGDRLPPADTVIFGAAGYAFTEDKLDRIRDVSRARFLLPTHYDNFFQPRARGLSWLPVVDREALFELLDPEGTPRPYLLGYDQWVTLPGPST